MAKTDCKHMTEESAMDNLLPDERELFDWSTDKDNIFAVKHDVEMLICRLSALRAELQHGEKMYIAMRDRCANSESRIMKYENDEASVCPEDVGFVEYIGVLEKRLQAKTDEADLETIKLRRVEEWYGEVWHELQAARDEIERQWIPVSERLPERIHGISQQGFEVFCFNVLTKEIDTGWLWPEPHRWPPEITHWRPLPAPPKEQPTQEEAERGK